MTRRKDPASDETQLTDELDVFEEFEAGEGAEEPTVGGGAAPAVGPEAEEPGLPEEEEIPVAPPVEEPATRTLADELAELAPDVPIQLVAVVGRTTTSVGDLIAVRAGQVIDLGRTPGETVDLVANGRLVARGELVEMDGKMGVRILKMVR